MGECWLSGVERTTPPIPTGLLAPRAGVVSISSFAFAFTFTFTFSIGFAFADGSAFAFAFDARAHATDQSTVSRPSPCAIRTRSLLLPRGAPCECSPADVSLSRFRLLETVLGIAFRRSNNYVARKLASLNNSSWFPWEEFLVGDGRS